MLKALIFDFDGLILDTETPEYLALNEAYQKFGFSLPVTTYGLVVGAEYGQGFEPVEHLQALIGKPVDPVSFWRDVDLRRMDIIDRSPALPGVENLIQEAKKSGLKLAVASSSPHLWVDRHLKRTNLFEYFDVVRCRDDVLHVKPEPDLFLAVLDALQMRGDETLVFEDSQNGVIAAHKAGIRVVLVPNPVTEQLNISGETLRLSSLADVSLAELLRKL